MAQVRQDSTLPSTLDTVKKKRDTVAKKDTPIVKPPTAIKRTNITDSLKSGADSSRDEESNTNNINEKNTHINNELAPLSDSFSMRPPVRDDWEFDPALPVAMQVLKHHPFFNFNAKPATIHAELHQFHGKEILFYALLGLLLLYALLKQASGKYYSDLFRVFFRTTLKQRQIREQLMQNPLSSLLFNIFFIASAGLYVDFMFRYFGLNPNFNSGLTDKQNFWLLYLYCCLGLAVIYIVKFIGLKLTGWLFNMKKAADSYIFIVFIINKVIGIFLLPFLVLLAFADEPVYTIAVVVSWCGIGALFLYRFILGFTAIRNEVRFNLFHFFLYLCAFEIAPLLLIYKLLLLVF